MAIKKRKERQRMTWLHSITDSMDMNLSKLWVIVKNRGAWHAAVHGVTESWTRLRDWITTATPVCKLEKQGWLSVGTVPGTTLQLWNPTEVQDGDPHGNTSMKNCLVTLCAKLLQLCLTLSDSMDCSPEEPRLFCPQDSPDKNTGVGRCALCHGDPPQRGIEPLSYISGIGSRVFYH